MRLTVLFSSLMFSSMNIPQEPEQTSSAEVDQVAGEEEPTAELDVDTNESRAFPGALGGRAFARADVEYTHRIVTNLNAGGPGSFRAAVQDNSIVTFNVADCTNTTFKAKNVIILGQTAPSPGFTLSCPGIRWEDAHNVISRYLTIRNTNTGRDTMDFIGAKNVIMDHSSFSFGGDETVSFRAGDYPEFPARLERLEDLPNILGDIKGEHRLSTHTATVSNSWVRSQGLDPATFEPLGNDLYPRFTNIETYSFRVDL